MIDRYCPTLSHGLLKHEFFSTAAAFGVLTLLGFAVSLARPELAQGVLERFTAQIEQLGLTSDVPQSQMMATLFFNNVTASLLSMLYGLIPFLPLSALALGTNALMLGAFAALYLLQGLGLGVYLSASCRTVSLSSRRSSSPARWDFSSAAREPTVSAAKRRQSPSGRAFRTACAFFSLPSCRCLPLPRSSKPMSPLCCSRS